jgi:RND family efflux transporter MFP subunit
MDTIKYILLIIAISILAACNNNQNSHGHSHDVIGGQATNEDHAHAPGTLSYNMFSEDFELFVEFPALSVNHPSTFAAHFTRLKDYKPVSKGKLTVSIIKGKKGVRHSVEAPSSPGIFRPALQPIEEGIYLMVFDLDTDVGSVRFEIPNIQVYLTQDDAAHDLVENEIGDEITFLKEQAWKTDFATLEVNPQPFHTVIHTSGKVKLQPQSETTLHAQSAGSVQLLAVLGETVKKGDLLAIISGSGIENNMSLKLKERKINFEKSRSDYIRSKPLVENKVVSQKDFLQIQSNYEQDSLRYYQLAGLVSQQGLKLTASSDGYISKVEVTNGEFVSSGDPVLQISSNNRILIKSFVNQSDFRKVDGIFDANFRVSGDDSTLTLNELEGKITSKNAFITENNTRIPVTFSAVNDGSLMPGMFLEVYLLTNKKDNVLVVPLSAIIEEQGKYFVFVQTGGESFVKREIEIVNNDGIKAEIQQGLKSGDRVVTRGAYQIKLASLSGDLPLHGHTH